MKCYNYINYLNKSGIVSNNLLNEIFDDVDTRIEINFSDNLPLGFNKFGAIGVTLFKRIYFLNRFKFLDPFEQIAIIRHELEHIQQQNKHGLFFYILYLCEWVIHFIKLLFSSPISKFRTLPNIAYHLISFEKSAYLIENKTKILLINESNYDKSNY
ncbi:MAG: hypothetical protein IPP08_06395 [Chlorobiota bacterium]|nr:MAG: hypothetical protein IPP08_06395 [Chlorobiota bacterium]